MCVTWTEKDNEMIRNLSWRRIFEHKTDLDNRTKLKKYFSVRTIDGTDSSSFRRRPIDNQRKTLTEPYRLILPTLVSCRKPTNVLRCKFER